MLEIARSAEIQIEQDTRQVDNLHHLERLANAMAPDPRRWDYLGEIIDTGAFGNAHCTCSHPIRYVFLIHNRDDGRVLPIGSTCISSSVPYLISNGAEGLATALTQAVEKLREQIAEAQRQVRDAANNTAVQSLLTSREAFYAWAQNERDNRTYLPRCVWEATVRRPERPRTCTTPGRTAASLRRKMATLYVAAMLGIQYPRVKMPLPEEDGLRGRILDEIRAAAEHCTNPDTKARYTRILAALEARWNK